MQANYGENEIKSLLSKARIFNKDIGTYQMFAITSSFDYVVKLSNGSILLKVEELHDDANDKLSPEQLQLIAGRYTSTVSQSAPDHSHTNTQTNTKTVNSANGDVKAPKKKMSALKYNLIVLGFLVLVFGVYVVIRIVNDNSGGGSYQQQVMSIEEIERSQPTTFLTADGTYRENFWGDKLKVSCVITNSATVATFKDAVVRVTYYSKTKTVLGTNDYTVYEVFNPNSTKTVQLKIDNYNNVKSIGWEVVSAVPY